MHEHSINIQYNILANTSTLAGGYAITHVAKLTPLLLLTFEDTLIQHDPIVYNE